MFESILNAVLPSFSKSDKHADLDYFERTRTGTSHSFNENLEQKVALSKSVKKEVMPLNTHDTDFHNYLFGESQLQNIQDPFSDFVSKKIELLLLSPSMLLNELPVMPSSVNTLMSELKNDDFDINKLLEVIEQEPSMAADVIKTANSAIYKRSENQVTNLKTAFMNMGAKGLMEAVLLSYIKKITPSTNVYFKQFGGKIWQHSLQTALYSKALIKSNPDSVDEATAYFVGLILNLGKMVIFQVMVEAFSFVDPDVPPNSQSFKNLISLYATELTFTIAKFWQMPTEILDVIEEQTSGNTRNCVLAKAIYDANIIRGC
ncbi:HDOD domain-containing protein [Pseudoalteromonas denitrificans]|uniref:HD-like signal output (HDOD) domain, no enzymatic activity n=1 Tax=Pseudoalteromonas denitrificans DSM 6059 TaxID=1123010 RepID=A0A1I1NZ20_9GAMM|nr:HDOD domain-containing protein [Pseudoalteromonas denitrificans]SFC99983.1 HD-like signal output (HDOD) domain, no enzymatic activity [Pseudoalteromonas denitrificans DSM 6059]